MTVAVVLSKEATAWVTQQSDQSKLDSVWKATLRIAAAVPMPHVQPANAADPTVAVILDDAPIVMTVLAAPEIERLYIEAIEDI